MPWLTPSEEAGYVYRTLRIPVPFLSQVNGALIGLEELWNWEEYGDMSPQECVDAMREMLFTYWEGNIMIGMVVPHAGNTIPDNALLCDGSVRNRVDYPDLYAALADAYIIDADTFKVPDLLSCFVMGSASNDGVSGGEANHTLTWTEMPSHYHNYHDWGSVVVNGYLGSTPALVPAESTQATASAGASEAHNNIPPFHALTYIIIAK
jgi:microcystin-dependent protein